MTKIYALLQEFGITRCYKGYHHASYCIFLAVTDEYKLESVTKRIYSEAAVHFDCSWFAVERNIRTISARAYKVNPILLRQIAGYPLDSAPTASEFIAILASHILRMQNP